MKTAFDSRFTLGICVASAIFAACGAPQARLGLPRAVPQSRAIIAHEDSTNYTVVYNFNGGSDGAKPRAGLVYKILLRAGLRNGLRHSNE